MRPGLGAFLVLLGVVLPGGVADARGEWRSSNPAWLTPLGGVITFIADDRTHGAELWRSDGTAEGTWLVKDMDDCDCSGPPSELTVMGGVLYFSGADDGAGNPPLWRSDGTHAGTFVVRDPASRLPLTGATGLTVLDDHLYLFAAGGLWRTDGTDPGTARIATIQGAAMVAVDGALVSEAWDEAHGGEIWLTDGATSATVVRDIRPGARSSFSWGLVRAGGRAYFQANDGLHGPALFTSDGTAAGTRLVRDIRAGVGDPTIRAIASVRGALLFSADDRRHGAELWRSDGTWRGTWMVRDIRPGGRGSGPYAFQSAELDGAVFFTATDGRHGDELWRSDGTRDGTRQVRDLRRGPRGSRPGELVRMGDRVYLDADDGVHGDELWVTDGTAAGTRLVADVRPGPKSAKVADLVVVGGRLFFTADDGVHGRELWVTDGTRKHTHLVKDLTAW